MNETFINDVVQGMTPFLDNAQLEELQYVLQQTLHGKSIVQAEPPDPLAQELENQGRGVFGKVFELLYCHHYRYVARHRQGNSTYND